MISLSSALTTASISYTGTNLAETGSNHVTIFVGTLPATEDRSGEAGPTGYILPGDPLVQEGRTQDDAGDEGRSATCLQSLRWRHPRSHCRGR